LSETIEFVAGGDVGEPRLDAEVLGTLSEKLLPSLFKLVGILHDPQRLKPGVEVQSELEHIDAIAPFDSHGSAEVASQVRAVADAIASLAKVAPQPLLQSLFSKVVQRLLEASQAEQDLSDKMCSLLVLSQALVISDNLDGSSIALLYRSLKPLIRTDETKPRIQKRAYKVLAEICNRRPAFVTEDGRLKELLELLTASSASSQVSARFMRIKCLENIVNAIGESLEVDEVSLGSIFLFFFARTQKILTISRSRRRRFRLFLSRPSFA
jgi:ribosomal RNA-processing protein 12